MPNKPSTKERAATNRISKVAVHLHELRHKTKAAQSCRACFKNILSTSALRQSLKAASALFPSQYARAVFRFRKHHII